MSADVIVTSFHAWQDITVREDPAWCEWPADLTVYTDDFCYFNRGIYARPADDQRLTKEIDGWAETQRRLPSANPSAKAKPHNYIWNAHKFAVKPFVWLDAADRMGDGVLTWLDADTVTHLREVPAGFSAALLGDASVAYLGRGDMHPETGFVAFRIPDALPLLRWMRDAYVNGTFTQWTDGWTDCHALRHGLAAVPVQAVDLTSHAYTGQWRSAVDAFALSPLAPYVRHLKGSAAKREAAACVI